MQYIIIWYKILILYGMYCICILCSVLWFSAPAMQFLEQNGFREQMRIDVFNRFFQLDPDYPANLAFEYDSTLKNQIMYFVNSRQPIVNDTAVNCARRTSRNSYYESRQYDEGSENSSEDSMDEYSWGDEDYVEEITDEANFNSLKGILANATLLRYTFEEWKYENPDEYQMFLDAIRVYNNAVAARKMVAAASFITVTGGVGLIPFASSLAVLQGGELFAEAVSKYSADKLASMAAGRDQRKYESYFKTCKYFTDFITTLGVQSVAPKIMSKAEKQIFNANKCDRKLEYPANFNTALKHKTLLSFQQEGLLTHDGMLTQKAINEAMFVIPFCSIGNENAKHAMMSLNRNGDWWKCSTKSIKVIDGTQSAEIHFYMDARTKQTYLWHDFKIKVNDNVGVGMFRSNKKRNNKK